MADRRGCSSNSPDQALSTMVFDCGLMDLGFSGPAFTWYSGSHAVRLDRCLGNTAWFSRFPTSIVHHLVRMKSDHRPLLLQTATVVHSPRSQQFKYFSGWSLHPAFKSFVEETWRTDLPIAKAIQSFSTTVSNWNRDIFGLIGRNKRILLARLKGVQRCLDIRRMAGMLKLELKLLQQLDSILEQEELMWKHKARIDWIKFGA
ncbi:hypothetical protein V6N13_090572 [Hibiscus sabdariffa]